MTSKRCATPAWVETPHRCRFQRTRGRCCRARANPAIRVLVLCGTESRHRVGETLKALHANGVDANYWVIGSMAPPPLLRNFPPRAQDIFSAKLEVVDVIGECDCERLRPVVADAARVAPQPWRESWKSDRTADRVREHRAAG